MVSKLAMLYNTLLTIETKGGHTKTMADCLRFLEQLMSEENQKKEEAKTKNAEDADAATTEKKEEK
ncbi:hypothetical protein BRYFOR_08507 [Marvinbryantia formatexigens DSM 14469]|uniref:Uncharacterized protein n=1 Tax=Marvinbryantia formatexigens DSM 14469 TaxID=478749 RepID=C6LIM7_9FIRM|nr:hypothetical protein [Marvinbryantia formatexigens]EET59416.1 hypothetical protein BRYFOR_08507 [Marvinbryantia formatexigens DSM 14469]UWO24101.1 hypothetical protein NQ534_16890 [Marvinbryantia formatexigens DSM 14469]SDG63572.1 hypothetical protein SAMN05660368_02941 [Marvinbryantia formatexigens]